jgi:hypothetical protein
MKDISLVAEVTRPSGLGTAVGDAINGNVRGLLAIRMEKSNQHFARFASYEKP